MPSKRSYIATVAAGLAVLFGVNPFVVGQLRGKQGLETRTLESGKRERVYHIHIPKRRKPSESLPVLFVLHGGGRANGKEVAKRTGFNEIADKERFVVVYPDGVGNQWNDGRGASAFKNAKNKDVNDVAFLSELIDHVVATEKCNSKRVYFTGGSNGGMMTHRVGIELGDKIAAIAPMISNIPVDIIKSAKPKSKMPVLIMNGTEDPMIPYEGGAVGVLGRKYGKIVSTDESIRFWKKNNKISNTKTHQKLDDVNSKDESTVEVIRYGDKQSKYPVVLYKIVGGGHTLPGRTQFRKGLQRVVGVANKRYRLFAGRI